MFGLGPTELAVILVLALLVMGPKRIPELASNLGKAIRGFRRATRELREQIDIDDEVRKPFEDLRSALRDEPPPRSYELMKPAAPSEPLQPADPPVYEGPQYDPAASAAVGEASAAVFSESTEAKDGPATDAPPAPPAKAAGPAGGTGP